MLEMSRIILIKEKNVFISQCIDLLHRDGCIYTQVRQVDGVVFPFRGLRFALQQASTDIIALQGQLHVSLRKHSKDRLLKKKLSTQSKTSNKTSPAGPGTVP